MTWLVQAMKDVASCDKLRVGASSLLSADFRMGQPFQANTWKPRHYVGGLTRGSETSQYPEEEKPDGIPPVVASEKGTA